MSVIKTNLSVIIMEPKIEGNVGAIARICNNFAVAELVLVSPQINHLSEDARKRAKHSIHYLENAKIYHDFLEIREKFDFLIGTSAKAGKSYNVLRQPVDPEFFEKVEKLPNSRIGFAFGREDRGLSNEEIRQCDFIASIPLPGKHKVLNISHAVTIFLYEFWKSFDLYKKQTSQEQPSSSKDREILFDLFNEITENLSYEDYRKPIVQHTFKTVINRSLPSKEEIHSLIGVFKSYLHNKVKKNG